MAKFKVTKEELHKRLKIPGTTPDFFIDTIFEGTPVEEKKECEWCSDSRLNMAVPVTDDLKHCRYCGKEVFKEKPAKIVRIPEVLDVNYLTLKNKINEVIDHINYETNL